MTQKLSNKIYAEIKSRIESGTIDNREFLSEAKVAEEFGVSKAPVRDALHLLADQGYLVSYHRKGYMVNTYTIDEINQIQIIRRQIERLSVELAIENASDEEIKSLKDYALISHNGNKSNYSFHMQLAKISGNKFLPDALDDFLIKISIAMAGSANENEKHIELIDALLSRDVNLAQKCIDADIHFL